MQVGVVSDPLGWAHWEAARAWLEPARVLGGFEAVWSPDEALWAAMDGNDCIGAMTARHCGEFVEVLLVGGRDYRRWLGEFDRQLGAAAHGAGATWLQAMGRRGWVKALRALGWDVMGEMDGMTVYRRNLG